MFRRLLNYLYNMFRKKIRNCEVNFIEENMVLINGKKWISHQHELHEIKKSLNLIIKNQTKIMSQISDLKEKVQAQGTALDTISGNVTGIQADVAALKQKIADLSSGATAAEIAELAALVDGVSSKIDVIGQTTADLDASTDPNNP